MTTTEDAIARARATLLVRADDAAREAAATRERVADDDRRRAEAMERFSVIAARGGQAGDAHRALVAALLNGADAAELDRLDAAYLRATALRPVYEAAAHATSRAADQAAEDTRLALAEAAELDTFAAKLRQQAETDPLGERTRRRIDPRPALEPEQFMPRR